MAARTALITGITGQDGSYLAEYLLAEGYVVHGIVRPGQRMPADLNAGPIHQHQVEITDHELVASTILAANPEEVYHLAANTFVRGAESETLRTNIEGTLAVLEAVRHHAPNCRLFLAGSSEMFGNAEASPQHESTPFRPRNVYGVTKVAGFHLMSLYRQLYGIFACCGILYNHESPRRPPQFVTRKITRAAAQIRQGNETELRLGNLDAIRDWGHARDYVRAMHLMLQGDRPDDYVVATGEGRTVRDFVEAAFQTVGLKWQDYVRVAPEFYRPADPVPLVGSASKAEQELGWIPKTTFAEIVAEMVHQDLKEQARVQ